MLDSLVRVSRRVNENRIVSIANPLHETLESILTTAQNFILYRRLEHCAGTTVPNADFSPQSPTAGKVPNQRLRCSPAPRIDADPNHLRTRALVQDAAGEMARMASSASLLTISSAIHALFKALFIFPSRYLFAIGLSSIFSFR
jgi:hypothetical protein